MKIFELDKNRKRTGNSIVVPIKQWEKMKEHWGNKLRWEENPKRKRK